MALVLSTIVTLATTCDEVTLLDSTGIYDVALNPTGWGAPNPETTDITAAVLTVECASLATPVTYNFFVDIADYLAGGLTINIIDLLGSDIAPDGLYTFTVTLTCLGTDYSYASTQAFFCIGKCCLLKKFSTLSFTLCVQYKTFEDTTEMFLYFFGMYWSSCCGNSSRFTNALNAFNQKCDPCGTQTALSSGSSCCGN
jgi:hypothetical protein